MDLRILLLEDNLADAELCERELKRAGLQFTVLRVETREAYQRALNEFAPNFIISDFGLPAAFDGLDALELASSKLPEIPFIFVSGTIGEERAVEAMKRGATDYVLKGHLNRLSPVVKRAISEAEERLARRRTEEALRESERRFSDMLRNIELISLMLDHEARITYCNDYLLRLTGWKREEIMGRNWFELFIPPETNDMKDNFAALLANLPEAWHLENEILTRSGERRLIRWNNSVLKSGAGDVIGAASIGEDITEQKLAEDKIRRLNRVYAVLSGINTLIVRVRDRDELFREACRIAVEQGGFGIAWIGTFDPDTNMITPIAGSGFEKGSLMQTPRIAGPNMLIAIHEKRAVSINDVTINQKATKERELRRQEAVRRGFHSFVILPLLTEGRTIGTLLLYAKEPNFFTGGELKLLNELAGDISFALEHIGKEERLQYLAYYDVLTGLPNRALFLDRLNQHMHARGSEVAMVAMILLNLERFTIVNETLGHQGGDELLRLIAQRLEHSCYGKVNLARIGADSFGVVIRGARDATDVAHIIESRVLSCFKEPYIVNGTELRIAAKAGIALYPSDGSDADALYKNAEAALKEAKTAGDRYLFYVSEMNARASQVLSLETRLRKAVEAQQFVLHYQPKLELSTGRICGMEALIRWQDPESGLVPPGHFIPLLEETGLITEVGQWALQQALADYRDWMARGYEAPRIAVNVSSIQLRQKDFVDMVSNVIGATKAMPHGLDIEITESLLMENIETNIQKLKMLREMEFNISIDDFGTGYSSLGYLARLPVNALKIDRSFIMAMGNDADSMSIVSTIISLGHSLNMKVIAEGVETEEQSRFLKLLKCDQMQGYLFSKPLPKTQIELLLKNT